MSIGLLFFVIVLVVALLKATVHVAPGHQYVVERLGKYHRTLAPGFHFLVPFVDFIRLKVSNTETILEIPSFVEHNKEELPLTIESELNYQIVDAKNAYSSVSDYKTSLATLTQSSVKVVLQELNLDQALGERSRFEERVKNRISDAARSWGISILKFTVKAITPPAEVIRALEDAARRKVVVGESEESKE